jgi:hypothetical protein
MMEYTEKRDALIEAQGLIEQAVEVLRDVAATDESFRRTIFASLEIMIEAGGWLSNDPTFPQLIREMDREYDLENEEVD